MTQELEQPAFSRESIEMLDAMGLGPVWLLRDSMDPLVQRLCGLQCGRSPRHRNDLLRRHVLNSLQPKREVSHRRLNPLALHRHPQLLRLHPRQPRSRRSA